MKSYRHEKLQKGNHTSSDMHEKCFILFYGCGPTS